MGSDSNSAITFPFKSIVYETETIEFWMRVYTPTLLEARYFVTQAQHFNFSYNISAIMFSVQSVKAQMASPSLTQDQQLGWFYVAGVIGLNMINCYLIVDDSLPHSAGPAKSLGNYQNSNITLYPTSTLSTKFTIGIREFRIWMQYKTYTELQGSRFTKPSYQAHGLALYIPMDESAGKIIGEKVTGYSIIVNETFWSSTPDYSTLNNGLPQVNQKDNVALMFQDNTIVTQFSFVNTITMYNEFSLLFWFKMSDKGQMYMNLTSIETFNLFIDLTKSTGNFESIWKFLKDTTSKGGLVSAGKWQAYAYTLAIVDRFTYANGEVADTVKSIVNQNIKYFIGT